MLRELRIRNLAVIEEIAVPLAPGFNVLTGETGAGKSILVDALLLIIGARAQPELIRSGEESAVVEALFEVETSGPVAALLDESEHRLLVEPARQLELLDRFAECLTQRERVGALVRGWEEARASLARLREELAESARQEDLYRFQLGE